VDHNWTNFSGNGPTMQPVNYTPFFDFSMLQNEAIPGLSHNTGNSALHLPMTANLSIIST
jgi:hypothetical protein